MNLKQWIHNQTELTKDFDFAGVIFFELYAKNTSRAALESAIKLESFQNSFKSKAQVIVCLETLTLEHLDILHTWLSERCCDILNFRLLLIGQPGAHDFWQQYNTLLGRNSFTIIEILDLPFGSKSVCEIANENNYSQIYTIKTHWRRENWYDFDSLPCLDRNPLYHAVYMPGRSNSSVESGFAKQYLALEIAAIPGCYVDQCYTLSDKQAILHWIERIHGWHVPYNFSRLEQTYDELSQQEIKSIPDWQGIHDTSRHLFEKSFATVVRETIMQSQFGCISEKTLRAFYHGQAVIPTSYNTRTYLEQRGFEFLPELKISLHEESKSFAHRVRTIGNLLHCFSHSYSQRDLGMLLRKHQDLFRHNSDLARKLTYFVSE